MNERDRAQRQFVVKIAEELRVGAIDRRQFIRAAGLRDSHLPAQNISAVARPLSPRCLSRPIA